jgi:N-hydroxyarylamine O-acetyltransferase
VVDLDGYFTRIGEDGSREPTLDLLTRIHELHPASIPFESLSPFIGDPVLLNIEAIQAKLVEGSRGGWCFEQNLLLFYVLEALGFTVKRLAARVRWGVAPDVVTPRSHCLLQVTIDGAQYIADVGFGGLTLTAPLRLAAGIEQPTPHEPHRILEEGGIHTVQANVAGEWLTLYTFELNEAQVADYGVSNWYLGNFPQSQFVTTVIAARSMPGVRHALRNNRYSINRMGADTERRYIATVEEFLEVLEGPFGIRVPRSARLTEKLARVIEANPPA